MRKNVSISSKFKFTLFFNMPGLYEMILLSYLLITITSFSFGKSIR